MKIAEGCNHPCTFCIIPQIRGRHRSRTVQSVVAEVRQLVTEGVKEVNLISQDTTFFGMDTWEERPNPRTPVDSSRGTALTSLLRELNAIEGDFWIRILYTHPAHWSDELIKTIAECPKVARYVDMPLQHISDRMLTAMQRETSGDYIRDLVRRIRAGIPGIALRTTFIVGFPGETEEDVDELCAFIREARFERLGVFRYSQEEGTRAAKMGAQVPSKEKERRWHRVMALQRDIATSVSSESVGRTLKVLVDGVGVARGEADAPDIDGRVYVPRESSRWGSSRRSRSTATTITTCSPFPPEQGQPSTRSRSRPSRFGSTARGFGILADDPIERAVREKDNDPGLRLGRKRVGNQRAEKLRIRCEGARTNPLSLEVLGNSLRVEALLLSKRTGAADRAEVYVVGMGKRPLKAGLQRPSARRVAPRLKHGGKKRRRELCPKRPERLHDRRRVVTEVLDHREQRIGGRAPPACA